MAISTYGSYLMKGTGTGTINYTKLIDIKSYGDIYGKPESLETTTLSDKARTFIAGLLSSDAQEFPCNYTAADFQTLKALEGTVGHYAIWFGSTSAGVPDGHNGKFAFDGELSVYVNGKGVNEVAEMTVTIMPSTVPVFSVTSG